MDSEFTQPTLCQFRADSDVVERRAYVVDARHIELSPEESRIVVYTLTNTHGAGQAHMTNLKTYWKLIPAAGCIDKLVKVNAERWQEFAGRDDVWFRLA